MEGAPQQSPTNEPAGAQPELPAHVRVTTWPDELIEGMGFGPRSMYVEMCWLPVMGPTATWLYRRLGSWAEFNVDGVTVDVTDVAQSLGLGESRAKNGGIGRALGRLIRFDAVRWVGAEELQVRTALGPLPHRYAKTLGRTSLRLHEELTRQPHTDKRGLNV